MGMEGFDETELWVKHDSGRLLGEVLTKAVYVYPRSSQRRVQPESPYESVSMGVELEMASGRTFAFTWLMVNKCQGLLVGEGRVDDLRHFNMELRREPAESRAWISRVDRCVTDLRTRWQHSESGCEPSVWAIELDFGPIRTLLALGELAAGRPTYMPDQLVVGFGDEAVASYRIAAEIADYHGTWG